MLQEGILGDVAPDAEEAQGPSEVKAGPWHHASRGTGTAPGPATRGHQGTPAGRCCPPVALLSITAQSRRGTGGTGCWGGALRHRYEVGAGPLLPVAGLGCVWWQ